MDINKIYSFSVVQYCRPEDLHYFIELQVNLLRECGGGIIGHLDVPDISKAKFVYKNFRPETIRKYHHLLRVMQGDGSYWHNMDSLSLVGQRLGCEVEVRDASCNYRSDIIYYVK